MNIEIDSQWAVEGRRYIRSISDADAGAICARLLSRHDTQLVGKTVSAELDVAPALGLAANTRYVLGSTSKVVASDKDKTVLQLRIEGQDEDGVSYLRLSGDCLIMAEVEPDCTLDVGKHIQLTLDIDQIMITVIGV